MSSSGETSSDIRPFHVDTPDEALDDLRRRIAATIRLSANSTGNGVRAAGFYDYPTSRPRRRWYSSSVSFPSLFMRSSLPSSSATLKPTACRI